MTKKENKNKGKYGENIAVKWLLKKKYQILEQNFFTKFGEIDIIAYDNNTIVFVEVKYRSSIEYGLPCQAVNFKKQRHIIKTAMIYLQINDLFDANIRFDIIEIVDINHEIRIRQIENAFDMSGY